MLAAAKALRDELGGAGDALSIKEHLQALEVAAYKIAESMYGTAPTS